MRIDFINGPDISNKTPQQAVEILARTLHDTMVQVMRLNNELEDIKEEVERLQRR